ncbi:3-dehydroquinate synthase II, partial [Streptomyces cellulosae]
MTDSKLCWLDIREAGDLAPAVLEEALHQRIDAVVAADMTMLADLPPTIRRVLLHDAGEPTDGFTGADLVLVAGGAEDRAKLAQAHPSIEFGRYVEITDADSLETACLSARTEQWSLLDFRDPTKIPLEIVLAAAAGCEGTIVTTAADVEEARIVYGVLELGSDGVLMPARAEGDATALRQAAGSTAGQISLVE